MASDTHVAARPRAPGQPQLGKKWTAASPTLYVANIAESQSRAESLDQVATRRWSTSTTTAISMSDAITSSSRPVRNWMTGSAPEKARLPRPMSLRAAVNSKMHEALRRKGAENRARAISPVEPNWRTVAFM